MKALTVWQPWAWLIVRGFKPVENRPWFTSFRGEVLIHAGKRYDDSFDARWAEQLIGGPMPPQSFFDNLRGGIVGVARITDCVRHHDSPWFFGPYGFVLDDAAPLPFIPCRGQQGLFDIDVNLPEVAA